MVAIKPALGQLIWGDSYSRQSLYEFVERACWGFTVKIYFHKNRFYSEVTIFVIGRT